MRKSRLRIRGTDRALMMLCRDARRRWLQYGENRTDKNLPCVKCNAVPTQPDHIKALGARPRDTKQFSTWLEKMFYGKCQPLCKECNRKKANDERRRRKK